MCVCARELKIRIMTNILYRYYNDLPHFTGIYIDQMKRVSARAHFSHLATAQLEFSAMCIQMDVSIVDSYVKLFLFLLHRCSTAGFTFSKHVTHSPNEEFTKRRMNENKKWKTCSKKEIHSAKYLC